MYAKQNLVVFFYSVLYYIDYHQTCRALFFLAVPFHYFAISGLSAHSNER